jgi:SAM-dependent MidA family methyltransferase
LLLDLIHTRIRERGPLTVAAFMDLALYHPEFGYYARSRSPRRSGASGDFVTSVDLGPVFGELLATQLAEMASLLGPAHSPFTLVEVGAGDGRLSHTMLRGLKKVAPHVCSHTHLHLVERSAAAREAQRAVLTAWTGQAIASDSLPDEFEGVIVANELLDAMPVHQVVMRETGLNETYVDADGERLVTREGPLSSETLRSRMASSGITLGTGARAEISLAATDWVRDAARRMRRGFIILIDYGDEAARLFGAGREAGTLSTYRRHQQDAASSGTAWLENPGEQVITAHADFTAVRDAAVEEGCTPLALMDQTYFLMALAGPRIESFDDAERLAFKSLVRPGGLGSTMKVLVLAKDMGTPALRCCSGAVRLT